MKQTCPLCFSVNALVQYILEDVYMCQDCHGSWIRLPIIKISNTCPNCFSQEYVQQEKRVYFTNTNIHNISLFCHHCNIGWIPINPIIKCNFLSL